MTFAVPKGYESWSQYEHGDEPAVSSNLLKPECKLNCLEVLGTVPLSRSLAVYGVGNPYVVRVAPPGYLATVATPPYEQIKNWGSLYTTPYAVFDPTAKAPPAKPPPATPPPATPPATPPAVPPELPPALVLDLLPRTGPAILAGVCTGLLLLGGFLALRRQTR